MAARIDTSTEQRICKAYLAGAKLKDVVCKVGVNQRTAARVLRDHNIVIRRSFVPHNKVRIDDAKAASVVATYQSGKTLHQTATAFGLRKDVVYVLLKNRGAMRCVSESKQKYHVNNRVFADRKPGWDYWAGFFIAEASVSQIPSGRWQLSIPQSLSEIAHLENCRRFLEADYPISVSRNDRGYPGSQPLARLDVRSDALVQSLISLGVTPRKEAREVAPDELLDNRNFWRGLVDGDGWVFVSGRGYPVVGLTGSETICGQFASFVRRHADTKANLSRNHSIWKFSVNALPAATTARVLYDAADPCMARKEAIARQCIEWRGIRGRYARA